MNNFSYMKDRDFSQGRKYIGASDIPTLAGINDYKTPYDLWAEWTGRKDAFQGNGRTNAGHRQEPIILGEYIRRKIIQELDDIGKLDDNGFKAAKRESNDFIVSRLWGDQQFHNYHSWTECSPAENPRFVAHADLLDLSGENPILVQAKNTGQFAADSRKRNPYKGYSKEDLSQNGIPIGVYFQEQWECYCYGIPRALVAVQIDGWDIKIYGEVEYRKKDVEKLVILADRFLWHIDKDIPPTPQNWPDVISIFPDLEKNTKSVVSGEDELSARKMIDQLNKINSHIKSLERRKLDINMGLALLACEPNLKVMHNYLTAANGDKLASFSEKKGRRSISLSRMEKEFPKIAEECERLGLISESEPTRSIYVSGVSTGSTDLFTAITEDETGKKKKSRKKYDKSEKESLTAFAESNGINLSWERYSK